MNESIPSSEVEFARVRRAVERGWVSKEQVEAAVAACDREPGSRLLAKLPLTPDQLRELDGETIHARGAVAPRALPPEVAEALNDPKRRVGRFVLVNLLGKGGMGMVFRGWEPELRQWVALKFLRQIGDETARAYFKREAQLAAGLDHPNIAKIYQVGEHEGQPFIAMQFVDGAPLSGKDLKLEDKIRIVKSIAEAVKFAHAKNIIHRDLKPANVMIDKNGQVYVMDFGLAKETAVEGESLGGSSLVVGTPSYMAPEQAKGKADAHSDVYGMGAILYELVTGRPPFTGETATDVIDQVIHQEPMWPRKLSPDTPEDVEAIILHALEKDPKRRYASAAELIGDLDAFAQKNPLRHARRPTLTYVLGKKIRKQPLLWASLTALLLAILGGAAFGTYELLRARSAALGEKRQAEEKARVEEDKTRVEREARERSESDRKRLEKAQAETSERLAYGYLLLGWQAEASNRGPEAAVFFAEANAAHPSELARANALSIGRNLPALCAMLDHDSRSLDYRALFSPDGRRVARVGRDEIVRLWDTATGEAVGRPLAHRGVINCIAFSPDGKRLATGGWVEKTAMIWNAETGEQIGKTIRHEVDVRVVVFSPDGRRLATGSGDKTVRLWDADTGEAVGKPMRHGDTVLAVAFSPDGSRLAAGCWDKTAHVWDARTGEPLCNPLIHEGVVSTVAFSPDGRRLATEGGYDPKKLIQSFNQPPVLRLWNAETGELIGKEFKDEGHLFAFHPDGRSLASACKDNSVRFRNAATGEPVGTTFPHDGPVHKLTFSADGRRMATAAGKSVFLWDVATGRTIGEPLRHPGGADALAFSSDGRRLMTECGGIERTWDVTKEARSRKISAHAGFVFSMAFSPDGKRIATSGKDGTARLWNPATGEPVGKVMRHEAASYESEVLGVAFSPDGKKLATGNGDKTARLWDALTGDPLGKIMKHEQGVPGVAFSPDGSRLATVSYSGTIRLWDAATGEPAGKEMKQGGPLYTVAYSPDGRRLATGGWTTAVRLWDAATGDPLTDGIPYDGVVDFIAFSPDGTRLATAARDKSARLWDASTGKPIGAVMLHEDFVNRLAFSRDGRRLATASADTTARLWDAATGEPLGRVMRHDGSVNSLAFTPDGRHLVTASGDKTARLWDAVTGESIGRPIPHESVVFRLALSPDGGLLATVCEDGALWLTDLSFLQDVRPAQALLFQARLDTGLRLGRTGEFEFLSPEDWRDLRRKLEGK